jgi:hypothetical protein
MHRRAMLALLLCVGAAACHRIPDEQAIRDGIAAAASAAGAQRSGDVLALVSDEFTGNNGQFDRAGVARLLRARLLARSITVSIGAVDVDLDGDRASATFDATLSDRSGRWLVEHGRTLHFVTGWRREGGTWRCYNARWTDAGP